VPLLNQIFRIVFSMPGRVSFFLIVSMPVVSVLAGVFFSYLLSEPGLCALGFRLFFRLCCRLLGFMFRFSPDRCRQFLFCP